MTKQELYTQALTKYDVVQPVAEWNKFGVVLGVTRYSMQVRKTNEKPMEYTVYVENDGGAGENAFVEGNPFADVPEPVQSFQEKVDAFIETKIADGTVLGAVTDLISNHIRESYVYKDNNGTIVREKWIATENADGSIKLQKIN